MLLRDTVQSDETATLEDVGTVDGERIGSWEVLQQMVSGLRGAKLTTTHDSGTNDGDPAHGRHSQYLGSDHGVILNSVNMNEENDVNIESDLYSESEKLLLVNQHESYNEYGDQDVVRFYGTLIPSPPSPGLLTGSLLEVDGEAGVDMEVGEGHPGDISSLWTWDGPRQPSSVPPESMSLFQDLLNYTLGADGAAVPHPEDYIPEPVFLSLQQAAQYQQQLSGYNSTTLGEEQVYNLTEQHQDHVVLFADYPAPLLDFAVVACVLFIILGVPGNLITIVALVKCKKVHNATAVFIINLTVSDLLFGVSILPIATTLFSQRTWVHTHALCVSHALLRYGLVAVSYFTVLAITINRYVMIAHPRLYRKMYSNIWLGVMVVGTWVGAFGALVPTLFGVWGKFGMDYGIGSCTILSDKYGRSPKEFLFVFGFLLPCVAILVCYARIFYIVHKADKRSRAGRLQINGKKKRKPLKIPSPTKDPPTTQTAHTSPIQDRLQLETLVKLSKRSNSRNSVRIEILEPGEKSCREIKNNEEVKETDKVNLTPKSCLRSPSPMLKVVDSEASSLINGYNDHQSEGGTTPDGIGNIIICPPSMPGTPTSQKSQKSENQYETVFERRPSTIVGIGHGAMHHLRGTFKRARASSFVRPPGLSPKDRRLLKMILVIFISYLACYLPITLVKTFSKDDNPILNILANILIYMTTCINPIIYVVMSSEYRQAYISLLTCRKEQDPSTRSLTKVSP
ncbi:unnamed protein product, partial [Meganyctiphanes norvegica]